MTAPSGAPRATLSSILIRALRMLAVASVLLTVTSARAAAPPAISWSAPEQLPGLGDGHVFALAIAPTNQRLAFAATDSGIYRSQDGGFTWQQTTLTKPAWTVGFDQRAPYNIYAGLQYGGLQRSTDSGNSWNDVSTGLPNPNVRALAFGNNGIFIGTGSGVAVSSNGNSWLGIGPANVTIDSVAVVSNSPLVLLAGSDQNPAYLYRNVGATTTWTPNSQLSGLPTTAAVNAITVSPLPVGNPNRNLLVALTTGAFRSQDGGLHWGEINEPSSGLTFTTATYSSTDSNVLYAGSDMGGSAGGDIYRATDGGQAFTPFDVGLSSTQRDLTALATAPNVYPPLVLAAVSAPVGSGGSAIVRIDDRTAPPNQGVGSEGAGAALPTPAAAPSATPAPSQSAVVVASSPDTGVRAFLDRVLHFPFPLIIELFVIGVVVYFIVQWRKRRLEIEGPP